MTALFFVFFILSLALFTAIQVKSTKQNSKFAQIDALVEENRKLVELITASSKPDDASLLSDAIEYEVIANEDFDFKKWRMKSLLKERSHRLSELYLKIYQAPTAVEYINTNDLYRRLSTSECAENISINKEDSPFDSEKFGGIMCKRYSKSNDIDEILSTASRAYA